MGKQRLSQRVLSLLLACVMLLTCAPTAFAESTEAALMRLMKTEGTVSVTNSKGRSVTVRDDMRLNSGYGLETEEASYAWINLDDAKLVKMDAVSEISIRKSGKKLDILLDSGNLFFNVSKPLEEEETFNIRTSTMAVGIRGTCGWVKVIDQWTSVLYVLEGTVTVTVTDPVTGETKTETVKGGETVTCKVYPQDTQGGKCDIIRQTFTVSDIDGFVLVELVKDGDLCDKIYEDSGLDIRNSGINAEEKLKEDQQEVHEKLEEINKRLEEQEHNISKDLVWSSPIPDGTETSESSDGDSTPVASITNQELVMPQTDDTVNDYLSRSDVSGVTLLPGTAKASTIDMLEVDSGITVPAGKTLTLRTGVRMEVLSGQTVALGNNAHITIGGAFISAGYLTGATGATVKATGIESSVPLEDWKQSDATDGAGYYTLTYSPKGVYTVTFNANGGSVSPAQMQTGRDSRLTSLPTPTRAGCTFDGWFTAPEGGEQITTAYVFSGDTTVYAHWTENAVVKHTITIDLCGGSIRGFGRADFEVEDGTTLRDVLSAIPFSGGSPIREEYSFAGWNTAADGSGVTITEDMPVVGYSVIYAQWTANRPTPTAYTVTFNANGGTVTPTTATTGMDGKLASLPTPTRTGFTFNGWFTAATGGTQVIDSTVFTQDTTVYAQWTAESTGSVTWRYDTATKTLYIEGSGKMVSVEGYDSNAWPLDGSRWPWYSVASGITTAIIGNGITTIDIRAFFNCTSLTSVTIPNSVTTIDGYAFDGCRSLTSVTIPNSVATIGSNAFNGCRSLTSVAIPSRVTTIGDGAFGGCSGLTSVTIPGRVTTIGDSAFAGCSSLTSVTIPNSVTTIGRHAFNGCTGLTSMTIPESVTSIDSGTFANCSSLTSVTIPDSVTSISDFAFAASLTDVYYGGTKAQWSAITIADNNDYLLNATIHCTDGDITPGGETSGVTWSYDSATKTLYIKGSGPMEDYASDNSSSANLIRPWKEYVSEIENLVIDNGITTIGDMAFASVKGLTSVTIPDSVISIGSSAFAASGLSGTITIPNSVTTIKAAAFYNCNSMNGVLTIPDSVTTIGSNAFDNTGLSGTLTIPGSVTSIGLYALNAEFTDVYYAGTEAQWNNITLGNSVIPSTATMHYNSTARSAVSYTTPSIYTDVPAGASYAEAVQYCKDNNLMDGTSADKFSPDGTLTRAMMVTVLHRLAGKPHAYATASFADVAPNKWYSDAISWASGKGIVNGYNPTTFGANDPVTHEQVGLILQRYSGDQSIQVTGGESPKTPATRAEVAVTLMNYAKGRKPGTLSDASAIDVMCAPSGIALDKDGSLLVTDVYGKQLWKVQNRNGTAYAGGATVIDLYGQPMGGYNDASLQGSYFKEPWAIAPFLDGWAVSDTANNVVRLVSGGSVRTLNGATREKLKVTDLGVAFDGPTGLASDEDGNLYVSDTGSGAVRRINPKGGVMTVAKNLSEPTGLCWKDGVLYIAETGKNRILKLTNGKTSTLAGNGIEGLTDGIGSESSFSAPQGVAVGDDGTVYVADTGNGAVRQIKGGTVTTLAVRDPEQLSGGLMSPVGLLARGNSLYICDTFARKIFVYQLG